MEEALIKRTMPNSLESEQSVVGSMIMDRDAILTASEILTKDDFYHQQYGVLFEAIVELYNSGQPVDLVTLQNKLREKDVPPEVASLEYISDLVAAVPVTVNVASYAQIVKDKALLRQIIKVNQEIENDCYNGKESVTEILEKTEHDIFALVQNHGNSEYVPIRQVVMMPSTRSSRHPSRRERLPVSRPDLSIWIIRPPDCSPVRSDLDRGASFYG